METASAVFSLYYDLLIPDVFIIIHWAFDLEWQDPMGSKKLQTDIVFLKKMNGRLYITK